MNQAIKAFVSEITVDSKCSLNELLTEFYKTAGKHITFNEISEQEKVRFRRIVEDMDMHESFVNHFLENFNESTTPLGLFEVVKHIDSIADATAVRIGLEKIFHHPEATTNMKDYIKVWLMQPLQVFDKLVEFLSQMMFDDELIFNEALKDTTMFNKAVKKALIHPEDFNLVSFVVFNENDIPARIHSRTEEVLALEIAGVESVKDIRERILTVHIDNVKGPETGLEGLRNATDCLIKIHRAYPTMQANMINYSTRSINGSMMGGARLSAAQVVRLYAGDYSNYTNVEQTDEQNGNEVTAERSPVRGLITDPEAFNALPPAGRRLVAQHLPATRKQFNQIVVNAINSVHTWMPQLMNAHTNNRELNRVIDGLAKSYNSLTGNQQGMVDWFMHKFAPAVNAYRARAMPSTGIAVVDNVFGGSPLKTATRIYGSGISGGAKRQFVNHDNEMSMSSRITGGGPIADYFEGVKRAQLKFNDQFDNLYRKLTTAVRAVADKAQFTSEQGISRVIEALMSITIASKKTVMKISGLKPKEDLNVRYTSMVEHVIKTIENTKISGFGEVISILRSFVSLLRSTHQEALSLIKRVSEATKSSEEIVKFINFEREEIYSKLTPQELHALIESINALIYTNHGHQLTDKIERHRDEDVKEYIKKVTDRTSAINDYYENQLDKWLKYNRSTDVDTKALIKSHIKSVQAAMVYLNEKVDTKLIQWRQKMAKGGNITKKQIEDIERLTMTYMHYRPGEKILQIFGKLEKIRQEVKSKLSIGDIYKVTGIIHKIVMNAGYIELLQQLYKTLEIDDGQFDWNLFKINVTKLLVDRMICIDDTKFTINCATELTGDKLLQATKSTIDGFSVHAYYELAKRISTALSSELKMPYNQLFNLVVATLTPTGGDRKPTAIHTALGLEKTDPLRGNYTGNVIDQIGGINAVKAKLTGSNKIIPISSPTLHEDYAKYENETDAPVLKIFKRIGITNEITEGTTGEWAKDNINSTDTADYDVLNAHLRRRVSIAILDHVTQILAKNKVYGLFMNNKDGVAILKKFVDTFRDAFIRAPVANANLNTFDANYQGTFEILDDAGDSIGVTWDGYFGVSYETSIVTDIFHSMIANVIYVFNRYIALRYTGTSDKLPIQMMSSVMLGGDVNDEQMDENGDEQSASKMTAGSAIDVIGVHDLKFDKVIPDAVPFYAIALNLFVTFMKELWWKYHPDNYDETENDKEYGDKAFRMYVNISDFSLLHNIHEILKDYTIIGDRHGAKENGTYALAPLSEVQLKMLIAELNRIWGLVSGSGKEKLMNAIDYIIGEINSSILFTSKNRFEQLKRDGHVDLDISTKLDQQFNHLLKDLEQVISDNLTLVTTMNPDAMAEFESFITNSVSRVSKETNETARLEYVREIINGDTQGKYKTPYEEYYKFCEFVVTPIMIAATSYKEAFNMFSSFNVGATGGEDATIDLTHYNVALAKEGASVIFTDENTLDGTSNTVSVTGLCEAALGTGPLSEKQLAAAASLINSAVVAHYNTILIRRALKQAISTNARFEMPTIWMPLVRSTYPPKTNYKLSIKSANTSISADESIATANSITMREMYPHIKSDEPVNYFNALLADFSNDFDHLLHSFMTYPGISDRFLMQLKDVHNNSTTALKNLIKKELWQGNDYIPSELSGKKLRKMIVPFVPLYPADLNMQPYVGTTNVPAISVQKYGNVSSDSYTMIGTGQIVYSISLVSNKRAVTTGNQVCHYGPLDWVVYKLAACNTTGYTLPVMLYEMLKSNTLFGKFLVECIVDGTNVMYTPDSAGYVNNVVTQNILTRSSTDRNRQESADLKTMNKAWIANLVSTIPGLVSYLKALTRSTDSSVKDYNGVSIEQLYITLTTIIESFYEECVAYMPFVPFMSDFIPGTFYASIERKLTKYHPIAEIYATMTNSDADCDGLKFEWANRAFYGGILQLPFPEYKNRDRFDDIKKWGGSIFQNSLFSHEFSGTMDIVARSLVRHRIIKRNANIRSTSGKTNVDSTLVDICLQTIRKSYELDPVIISILINNIIRVYAGGQSGNLLGGGVRSTNAQFSKTFDNFNSSTINRLLIGIFDVISGSVETKNNYPKDLTLTQSIDAALSLLYDNPNVRPFYGFREGRNADYGKLENLVRGIDAGILGAMKYAAEGKTVDATTRGKQLFAFSVVNEKRLQRIEPTTSIYSCDGTIGTSARYASNNLSPNLRYDEYVRLTNDTFYRPADIVKTITEGAGAAQRPDYNGAGPSQKAIAKLIEGFANTSRLAIASNAISSVVYHILNTLDSFNLMGDNETDRAACYEIFNWLSLGKSDPTKLYLIKNTGGDEASLFPVTMGWANGTGAAGNGEAGVNGAADDIRVAELKGVRWDMPRADTNYILSFTSFVPADAVDGVIFDDGNRLIVAKVLRAIMATDDPAANDLDKVIKTVFERCGEEVNANDAAIRYDQAVAAANMNILFGKQINNNATAVSGNLLSWMLRPIAPGGEADVDDNANICIADSSIARLNRLMVLYMLFTRHADALADWAITNKDAVWTNASTANTVSPGLISVWCRMFGINIAAADVDRAKVAAVLKFVATAIEIGMRTPIANGNSNVLSMVNALGAKLAEYYDTIVGKDGDNIKAITLLPNDANDNRVLAAPGNYDNDINNAVLTGSIAASIFRLFWEKDGNDGMVNILARKLSTDDNANIAVANNKYLWFTALSGMSYNNNIVAANTPTHRTILNNNTEGANIGLNNYRFIPLNDTFNRIVNVNNDVIFCEKLTATATETSVASDKQMIGGSASEILNACTASNNHHISQDGRSNDCTTLSDEVYKGTKFSGIYSTGINTAGRQMFMDTLRILGFISLGLSNRFSARRTFGEIDRDARNLLLSAFQFRRSADLRITNVVTNDISPMNLTVSDIVNVLSDIVVNLTNHNANVTIGNILNSIKDAKLPIINGTFVNALFKAAQEIDAQYTNGFVPNPTNGCKYKAAAVSIIGTETHNETNILLTKLPKIVPSITPHKILTNDSVKIYKHLPRAIAEYMLWNPGYELFNVLAPIPTADLINIPFNDVIRAGYSKFNNNEVIVNVNGMLKYSLTMGMFDTNLYDEGNAADGWMNMLPNADGTDWRGVANRAKVYTTVVHNVENPANNPQIVESNVIDTAGSATLTTKLTDIIDKWCNKLTDKANTVASDNGFSLNMLGGDVTFTTYIDPSNVAAGEPYKIYPSIYPVTHDSDTSLPTGGLKFYNTLFRAISKATTTNIGTLALAYFNRSLLTFSGVLSNYVFPNSIYGKGIFNRFASGLSSAIDGLTDITTAAIWKQQTSVSDSNVTKARWNFYMHYVKRFACTSAADDSIITASDRALYPLNQCAFNTSDMTADSGIRKFDEMTINNLANTLIDDEQYQSRISSEFTAPSICNSFLTILHNLILGKANTKNGKVDPKSDLCNMQWFMGTETMGALRSLDSLLTYTSVLAALVKQLSFFDMDEDMERTYVARDPAEPYMGIEPDDKF